MQLFIRVQGAEEESRHVDEFLRGVTCVDCLLMGLECSQKHYSVTKYHIPTRMISRNCGLTMVEDVVGPFVGPPVVAHRSIMRYDAVQFTISCVLMGSSCGYFTSTASL
ncbi:unnamed protein product [Brugia pahangi]|uniref:DUF3403 domain-containing protein n=1 Tax=Brugia pahangi TaxID=6280 RepID=A0A0N4SYG3_BRUPA|nr:unnamed protein product [Brugia pahangi]